MPWLLYRFILTDLLRIVGLTGTVMVTVIAFGATIRPLASDSLLDATQTLKYLGLAIIPMLQFALPFAAGFGATLTMHRMTTDNEIQAMAASGISYRRILTPIFATGMVLVIVMVLLTQWIIPRFWTAIGQMLSTDVTKLFQASIRRHEPFQRDNLQIYADDIVLQQNPEGEGGPETRMVLLKLAAATLDDDGRAMTDFTADKAVADVYRREGRTIIKLAMNETVGFNQDDGVLVNFEHPVRTIEMPTEFQTKTKTLTRGQLLALRENPDGYAQVIEAKLALAAAIRDATARAEIDQQLRQNGRVELLGEAIGTAGEHRSYFVTADKLYDSARADKSRDNDKPHDSGTADKVHDSQFELRAGGRIEIVQYDGGEAIRKFDAATAQLVPAAAAPPGTASFDLELGEHDVVDLRRGGAPNHRPHLVIATLGVSGTESDDLSALSSSELLQRAATTRGRPEGVKSKASKLVKEIESLQREITSRLLNRYALSMTALLLLVLGAVLAMWLRGSLPLATYTWAFLPAVMDLILISAGEQLLRDGRVLGHFVMWSGNAFIVLTIAVVYSRLRRN